MNWVAPNNYKGHGFTLKLSDCKLNIAGIQLKNSCCKRAVRAFHIFGILEDGGPWVQFLEGELDDPTYLGAPRPTLQTFHLKEAVETKFLKFDVDSYWGPSAALNYFEVIIVKGNNLRYALKEKKRYYLGIFPKRRTPPPTPPFWEPLIQKRQL